MQNKVYLFYNGVNIFLIMLAIESTSHESHIHPVMLMHSYTGTQVGRQILLPTRERDTNPQLRLQLVLPMSQATLVIELDLMVEMFCTHVFSFFFFGSDITYLTKTNLTMTEVMLTMKT